MDDRINRIKPDKEVDRDWQETVSTISAVQEGAVPENGEEKNKYLFEKMPVPQALAAMAVPTVISQLIVLIYNMADTFYIGRTNNPYMVAGAALILPIFNVCIDGKSAQGRLLQHMVFRFYRSVFCDYDGTFYAASPHFPGRQRSDL